ncbi:DUF190 domain-containing protein [Azospirillum sp. ST 5-10]|uniref:DUF190 domain-containing protein n=1 Tax=unclassified Azospirillum TaxID=2630922 RepID=UPI003F4A58FA
MQTPSDAVLLRVHTSEQDKCDGKPFYEAVVLKARELGLRGATVLRGVIGYGHDSHIHTSKILDLSLDLPLVVEIVDDEDRINAFLPVLDRMMETGTVTLERVRVIRYGAPAPGDGPA